jgi:hypothetical protein
MIWALSVMSVAATEPDLYMDQVGGMETVQESLHWSRHLHGTACTKTSRALDEAEAKGVEQVNTAVGKCTTSPCTITYSKLSQYPVYKNACIAAKGVFATYKVTIVCPDSTLILDGLPECLVSTRVNKGCVPKLQVDEIEMFFDEEDCTEKAVLKGTADYSTRKPVKKPGMKPVKHRRLGSAVE